MFVVRRLRPLYNSLYRGISTQPCAPLLVTPAQVASVPSQTTVFLDSSWFLPTSPRNSRDEFLARRIPRARFLDIDQVASHTELGKELGLKHMMPQPEVFAQACENFGITQDSHVVLYDTQGCFSSPRALFMFRAFYHANSSVLNGGLPRWIDEGLPVETGPPLFITESQKPSYPIPKLDEVVIKNYEQMVANSLIHQSDAAAELVLDARSRGRYLGVDPEPRLNIPSGHIPRSLSLPFTNFISNHSPSVTSPLRFFTAPLSDGYATLRSPEDLIKELHVVVGTKAAEEVLAGQRKVITTCGSGMTAAILWLGLSTIWEAQHRELGSIALYDESWTGYAARKESKIAKG